MTLPADMGEWMRCGIGVLLVLYGLLGVVQNACILVYNIVHCWVRKDGLYSSFVPLTPWLSIVFGGMLLAPFVPHIWLLALLDAGLWVLPVALLRLVLGAVFYPIRCLMRVFVRR